jgi:hypothetical protein
MTPQPTTITTPARNGRRPGTGLQSGRGAVRDAGVRRRALVAALGLAVLAAVVPVTAAHAAPQSPEVDTHLTNPGGNPQPPQPPEPPQPPNPDPVSTGDHSIPTPQRVDAGFGGTAAGPHQAAGLALIGAALVLTLLVIVIARRHHGEARSIR